MQKLQNLTNVPFALHLPDSDYSLPQALLNFTRGSQSGTILCAEVGTVDDEVEEGSEVFNVQLVPMAPDITAGNINRLISITILDDDGECSDCTMSPRCIQTAYIYTVFRLVYIAFMALEEFGVAS